MTPRTRIASAVVLGVALTVLVLLHIHGVNGPEYWRWEWKRRTDIAVVVLCLGIAASPALFAQLLTERKRNAAIALLCVAVIALQLTSNAIEPHLRGAERIRRIAADQLVTSYFTVAESIVSAEKNGRPVDWLRQYDDLLRLAPQHATTKPPGPVAFYVTVIRLFGSDRAPIAVAGLLALLSAGAVVAMYAVAGRIAGPAVGFQAATLFALAPSMTVFFLFLDTVYPILSCALVATWFATLKRGSRNDAIAFGLVLFATTMTSYTLLVLGITLGGMTLAHLHRGASVRRTATLVAIALVTVAVAYGVVWLSTGFNPLSAFRTAVGMQYRFLPLLHRPYPRTIPFDLLDFFLGAGWIPVLLTVFWLTTRRKEEEPATGDVALWGLMTPAVVALAGLIQAETARVWIFMLPLLMFPAALELSRWPVRHRLAVHAMMIAVTIALYANMTFIWTS